MRTTNPTVVVAAFGMFALGCGNPGSGVGPPRSNTDQLPAPRVVRSFPAKGVNTVIIRTAEADTTTVVLDSVADAIEISGQPSGGAKGYHPSDPNWKETPAGEWGLDFVAEAYGPLLVISSKSEIRYIHHLYTLQEVKVRVPAGVEVLRQKRALTGDGGPDLSKPEP